MSKIVIGTRGSKLALWQAYYVKDQLEALGTEVEIKIIKTKGDMVLNLSFDKIEGKGFFTKEIEEELLSGQIDLAVHSMKDMPTTQPEGLVLAGVSYREDPADLLIMRQDAVDMSHTFGLKKEAKVGSSSVRRKAIFNHYRPDCKLVDIRGNVQTRLSKLETGDCDAILLALAGMNRLEMDLSAYRVVRLSPKEFVPAPAQGVLAYQTRREDKPMRDLIRKIHNPAVSRLTNVERRALQLLGGGCHVPFGAYAEQDTNGFIHVWASYAKDYDQPLKQIRLSSSSTFGLSEKIIQGLKEA